MPRPIDHAVRKRHIVAESVRLFARYGYADVTFGMIARESGVSRTLVYTYFKDKREIFNAAISQVTSRIRAEYEAVLPLNILSVDKLRRITMKVMVMMYEYRDFICVIVDVLTGYRRAGINPHDRVEAHTEGLRKMIGYFLQSAVHGGEYGRPIDVQQATSLIYSQFEAAALRIAVTGRAELPESVRELDAAILSLRQI